MAGNPTPLILRCIVADDEPLARKGMCQLIAQVPFLHCTAIAKDAREVMQLLESQEADILFLDIQMPGLSGVELARSLPDPPRIIFTTAYPEYALEGYELDVLDYLLKPVTLTRFLKAAYKAKAYFENPGPADPDPAPSFIFVKTDKVLEKIPLDEILYVEACLNYVFIHMTSRKVITYSSIKAMMQVLPAPTRGSMKGLAQGFLKVHKSFIVSLSRINRIEGNSLTIGDRNIPVSRASRTDLVRWIT
jgi:two-component system, LytTR family, response regulator